jgi:hypothetical protein
MVGNRLQITLLACTQITTSSDVEGWNNRLWVIINV